MFLIGKGWCVNEHGAGGSGGLGQLTVDIKRAVCSRFASVF